MPAKSAAPKIDAIGQKPPYFVEPAAHFVSAPKLLGKAVVAEIAAASNGGLKSAALADIALSIVHDLRRGLPLR